MTNKEKKAEIAIKKVGIALLNVLTEELTEEERRELTEEKINNLTFDIVNTATSIYDIDVIIEADDNALKQVVSSIFKNIRINDPLPHSDSEFFTK